MPAHPFGRLVTTLAISVLLGACRDATGTAPRPLHVFRSPDRNVSGIASVGDSMFYTTTWWDGLWRARALTGPWERVATFADEEHAYRLFPLADGSVLLTTDRCMLRWQEGAGLTTERVALASGELRDFCPGFLDVERTAGGSVHAVTSGYRWFWERGRDGVWHEEPMDTVLQGNVWALASLGDTLWAATDHGIARRPPGGHWAPLLADSALRRERCWTTALAASGGTMYSGKGACVAAVYPGTPRRLAGAGEYAQIFDGDRSSNVALFWEYTGAVFVVRNGAVRPVDSGGLGIISQAIVVRDTLVIAGVSRRSGGVIAVVPLRR